MTITKALAKLYEAIVGDPAPRPNSITKILLDLAANWPSSGEGTE